MDPYPWRPFPLETLTLGTRGRVFRGKGKGPAKIPQGYPWCSLPSTFSAFMNDIFQDLIVEGKIAVYLNDILIFSTDLKEHHEVVHKVLRRLEQNNLFLKSEKCQFERSEIEWLGMVFS